MGLAISIDDRWMPFVGICIFAGIFTVLGQTTAESVDFLPGIGPREGQLGGRNPHNLAILEMKLVYGQGKSTAQLVPCPPQTGGSRQFRAGIC